MRIESVVFYTNNISTVKEFYLNSIGLKLDYETPNFISFLFPDGIKLGIKLKKEPREIPGSQTVFISVAAIEQTYNEYKAKGVRFSKGLTKETWAYEFAILDPDGNKLTFKQAAI